MSKRRQKAGAFEVPRLTPRTPKQKEYLAALRSSPQVFAVGPAGTGKTWMPSAFAGDLLRDKQVSRIIISKPNVSMSRSIGYFPGTLMEKMGPWVIPMLDTIKSRIGPGHFDYCINKSVIEVVPFETMRGRSFEDAFILIDEAQNLTPEEMYLTVTRIGEESRLVITGDLNQMDIRGTSGLSVAIDLINRKNIPAAVVEFDEEDVVRSGLCAAWVKAWDHK